jgi:hypothetical protein
MENIDKIEITAINMENLEAFVYDNGKKALYSKGIEYFSK